MIRFELTMPLLLPLLLPITATGQQHSQKSESLAVIGAICSDRHVPDSALYIRRLAASMPPEARYKFLSDWVLPSPSHTTFRLALDFSTTHPAPSTSESSGGTLVSPALDLIETAATLKRLDELRSRISPVESQDELQQRCRQTMLGLVELAAGQPDKAVAWFEDLYSRVAARTYDDIEGRWPETLAVHASLGDPRAREAMADTLHRMLQSQVRVGVAHGPDAWDRWVTAAAGSLAGLRSSSDAKATKHTSAPDSGLDSNWMPVSKMTAWSRGHGFPCAAWRRHPGMVENVASHDEDYLVYRTPLRGNFEIECDVTSFNWRDSHLLIAGTYVAPIYDRETYGVGSFRAARSSGRIEPRLSDCDDWIRYRAIVRDGNCSTYFNGRLIHTEPLTAEHDPWLAIRSAWYADGAARNLRITGEPIIPEQIRLSASSDLSGWSAYFLEPVGGDFDHWRQGSNLENGGGIIGRHEPGLGGLACERLLQYYRPMLEDGTIEYEFYYRAGESHVHPALDRRAMILTPHGVQVHWITDGVFERSLLSPENLSDELHHRRGPRQLPFIDNSWNRMRITLAGNALSLTLNDHLVYQVDLESTNQRTFGLFYWSDRTEARVRNVVWTGDWPKELPPVEEQELAGEGTRFLDQRLPQLTSHFQHDFARDGLPLDRFLAESKSQQLVETSENGVRIVARASKGFTPWWIGPKLRLEGDFDIRAEFENLQLSGTLDSSTGLFLQVVMEDPETTHAAVYRGCLRKPNAQDRIVVQAEFNRRKPSGILMTWPGSTAEESTSGTLRLARRGDTLYCLFAEAESTHFRLIHTEVVPRDAVRFDGVRLMSSVFSAIDGPCEVAVTWKNLSIWGETITESPKRRGALAPKQTD